MAAIERRMGSSIMSIVFRFILFIGLLFNFNNVHGFNMDLKSPFIFKSPDSNSFFGYSLAFHKDVNSVFVGAPKSKENSQGNNQEWGAVYQCRITKTPQPCKLFSKVDALDNNNVNNRKNGQWMGATVYSDQNQILACAPRFSKTSDTGDKEELLFGKCDYVSTSISTASDFVFNPCESISSKLSEFKTCQAGFSATIAVNVEKVIYGGGPNIQLSRGKIAMNSDDGNTYRFTPSQGLNFSDYMGYSVTSGRFTKDKKIVLVGGAPRGNNLGGKVILYEFDNADGGSDLKVFSNIYDPSDPPQTGSYFGSVVASADINGDEFADLVIGAPQYANTAPNQGAVHVYMNDKNGGLKYSKQVFYGEQEDGFFGYAIGSVGDLNGDGMQEIAVGAPWAGANRKGIVYLYYGSKNKEAPLVLKQVITPADVTGGADLDGFGFSFADYYPYSDKGNNMDLTGYNELVIGAYRSGQIAVLRSRPVITVVGEISLGGITKIDLYSKDPNTICDDNGAKVKCIKNVKVCFQIPGTKDSYSLKYKVNLDAEQVAAKRGYFRDGNGQEINELSASLDDVTSTEKCAPELTIFLKNNTKDILRPFGIVLTWDFTEKVCAAGQICPIQNAMLDSQSFTKIPYVKGCSNDGNDECNSDLQVTMDAIVPGGGKVIAIGVTEKVTVTVDIKNAGENAFINVLELIYPPVVSPNKVTIANFPGTVEWDPNVLADSDILMLRVKLSSPLKEKSTEKVAIVFSVLNVGKGNEVVFQAEAKTGSVEMNDKDNKATIKLSATLSANLTVSGRVTPEQIKWNMKNKDPSIVGPKIEHTFFFQNMGPSIAEESDVEIKIPEMLDNSYMLNMYDVNLVAGAGVSGTIGTCNVKQEDLNPLKLDVLKKNATVTARRKRRNAPSERIDCADSKSCRVIKCKLTGLGKSQSATVTVRSTLVEATFDKFQESRQLVAFAKISSDFVKRPNNAPPDTVDVILSVNSPYLKVEKDSDPIKWWVILLCILGAIIIIGLIVFILYKKGFFKRKKHGEEEEEEEGLRKGDPDDEY